MTRLLSTFAIPIAIALTCGVAHAQDRSVLPPGRTGGGGANQAAGPGGQHPGQAGMIPLPKAAVFDIKVADPASGTALDKARLAALSDALRKELALQNLFDVVAITPEVKAEADKETNLRDCNGCNLDYAKRLGAAVAVTVELQPLTALVSNLNVFVQPAAGGAEQKYTANVPGNDEASLRHAVKYVVDEVMVPKMARAGQR